MNKREHLIINLGIIGILLALFVALVFSQTGLLNRKPTVDAVADNCYDETLYVISDKDYSPYSFYDDKGNPSGHDVELMIILANRMKMNLDLRMMDWDEGIAAIDRGEADVLMTCGYSDNFEGLDQLIMSAPISVDDYAVYSKGKIESADSMYGKRIAYMKDGNVTPQLEMLNLKKYSKDYVDNRAAMEALEMGEADYAVMRQNVGDNLISELGYSDITAQISIGQSFMCFGINSDEPELADKINATMEELKMSGELRRLYNKWLTTFIKPYTLKEVVERNPWIAYLFLSLLMIAFVLFYRSRKNEDKRHEEQLKKEQIMQERLQDALYKAQELNRKNAEQSSFTSFFLEPYQSAYYVSLDTLSCQVYKRTEELERKYPIALNFVDALNKYIKLEVHPDDREQLSKVVSPENMKASLMALPEFSYVYRVLTDEGERYCRLQIIRGADENHAAFGFKDVTEEITEQKERADKQKRADDYRSLVDHFITNFEATYLVNLNENTYKSLKGNDMIHEKFHREDLSFSDIFRNYVDTVYQDDRNMLSGSLNLESIREDLETKGEYTVRYRSMTTGFPVWYEMHVLKINDSEIILAFANVDDQVLREQTRKAVVGDYFGLYLVDVSADSIKVIKRASDRFRGGSKIMVNRYSTSMSEFINLLPERYRAEWEGLDTAEGLSKFFAESNKRDLIFESIYKENSFVRCSWYVIERVNGEPHTVCFAVSDLDEVQADREKLNEKIAHQKSLLDYFVESYESAYSVDLINDSFEILHMEHDTSLKIELEGNRLDMEGYINRYIHPDDRELMKEVSDKNYVISRLRSEKGFSFTVREIDGDEIRIMKGLVVRGIDEYHVAVGFLDITEELQKEKEQKEKLEQALLVAKAANQRSKVLHDIIKSGSWSFYVDANDEIVGTDFSKEVLSLNDIDLSQDPYAWSTVIHPDDKDAALAAFKATIADHSGNTPYDVVYRMHDSKGEYRWFHSAGRIIRNEDGTGEFFGMHINITEQVEENERRQNQLKEALSMAESANRAKTTFLNSMSHDIRTPMNAIIGYAGLATSHIDNKEQVQDYLNKISQSSDHLLSLINDVLDMSRIESGKMHLSEKEENLSEIIHSLCDIVRNDVQSRHLNFLVDAVDINDEDIVCDKLRLNQILINILSNSIKYTASGGTVEMTVTEKPIRKSGVAAYEFRIKDNGMGMSKEFLKHIFDPFERVKSSTVSGIQGTGLGMSITKNIVEMMGATIDVQSELGKGTEVTVNFEFTLQNAHAKSNVISELYGERVLIVNDSSETCMSISKTSKNIGIRPDWCTSGKEAILRSEEAYKNGEPFGIFIIDSELQDLNGSDVAKRICRDMEDEDPIIVMTAYDWSETKEELKEEMKDFGVFSFINKPIFPSDLHEALVSCLGRKTEPVIESVEDYDFMGKKILLVEDNELNREIAMELLTEYGFIVDTAENGDIAVEKMRNAVEGEYDLVLMDVQMPTIDGYEATRQIRALGTEISKIPILAMSANAFEEDRLAALEAGMDEHIAKPIDVRKLVETLYKFIK